MISPGQLGRGPLTILPHQLALIMSRTMQTVWPLSASRGPCLDGRFKPDIVAPGTNVVSTKSSLATDLWGSGGLGGLGLQDHYIFSGGTSMSAPLVAGAATLGAKFLHRPGGDHAQRSPHQGDAFEWGV